MNFTDFAPVSGVIRTAEGYLVASVKAARTGIQDYAGWEVGKPAIPVVRVYRPPESVFAVDSLETFPNIPLTLNHPVVPVNAETFGKEAVGNVTEVARDGEAIRATIQVMSKRAVDAIQKDGIDELSVGYEAELDFSDGVTPKGEPYDAIQKNIKANHLAIVKQGRAGPDFRIGDDAKKWGIAPLTNVDRKGPKMSDNLRIMMVDGLSVETTDQGAQAIEKLQKQLADTGKEMAEKDEDAKRRIKEKDEEIGSLKAKNKKMQDDALTPEKVTKLVADRVALETAAKKIVNDITTDNVSDEDLRKAVVVSKMGAEFVADASDAEISGMFKAIAKDAAIDPIREATSGGIQTIDGDTFADAEKAYGEMLNGLETAHLGDKGAN